MLRVPGNVALDRLRGIAFRPVYDGVGERLGQRQFDVVLASRSALHFPHHIHHAAHHRIDGIAIAGQGDAEFEIEFVRVEGKRLRRLQVFPRLLWDAESAISGL